MNDYSMSANSFSVNSSESFSMHTDDNKLAYFNKKNPNPSLILTRDKHSDVQIKILKWENNKKEIKNWIVKSTSVSVKTDTEIFLLKADCNYIVSKNGTPLSVEKSDGKGKIKFSCNADSGKEIFFELKPAE